MNQEKPIRVKLIRIRGGEENVIKIELPKCKTLLSEDISNKVEKEQLFEKFVANRGDDRLNFWDSLTFDQKVYVLNRIGVVIKKDDQHFGGVNITNPGELRKLTDSFLNIQMVALNEDQDCFINVTKKIISMARDNRSMDDIVTEISKISIPNREIYYVKV